MDETALVRHVTGLRGTVVKVSAPKQAAIERASLADRRSYISYLACITHDAAVQALLPQVLLGNEHQFTLALLRSVSSQLGPNIQLWRQKSAWNSHQTMRRWLTTLKKALGSLVESRTVVVLVDVHPSHIHNTIFQHARRCGVRLVYIPAKLHLTSSNTLVTLACLSPVCLPLSGKLRAWCPPRVSLCISSFHILSDVLRTLTSPRWPCIILIFSTLMAKLWPLAIMKIRSPTNSQPNSPYYCSGYRLLHWSPRLSQGSNRLPPDDVVTILKVAATLSFYVARQVRRNQESSKLLILTPHNDTVEDIIDAVGLPSDNLPPSLYEFYLVMIYKQQLLPTTISEFKRTDHAGKQFTPHLENVTLQEIHAKISNDPTLHQELERRATIETIVQIALDFPKGFSSYCTISNTVKAIGIGGVASVFVSCKISDFLTKTKEAQARNLVALTRSKGLCVLLLPSTDKFITSSLHFLRTLCAFRHGMFSIGASPIDIPKLGTFITQSDVTHEDSPSLYTAETWQIAHQIAWYGTWHCLPLAIAVSYANHTFYFTLSLRTGVVPSSNVHQLEASAFEWKGSLPNHPSATISFAQNGLVLQAQYPMVLFPFPAGRGSTAISSTNPTGYSLRPVSGTYFFANASFNTGHTHPLSTGLHDPDDIALPPQMIQWPQESPAVLPVALATPEQRNPVPPWLPAESKTLYQQGLDVLTTADILHNSNPAHWLPAYCAHALSNFAEEHLSVLANPDT